MAEIIETFERWSHYNPVRIVSGRLIELASDMTAGKHILLVTSEGFVARGIVERLLEILGNSRVSVLGNIKPNPDLADLDATSVSLRKTNVEVIVAIGGGSVIDASKALASTLLSNSDHPLADSLGSGKALGNLQRLPLIVVPTTAGTGAEVTPFATIWDHKLHKKYSLGGQLMYPDMALLDPSLTLTLPESETLFSALDAISHALESLWNRHVTPISRALSFQTLTLATSALPSLLHQPQNIGLRSQMQSASLMAGLAISQTRTALAHSISYPLTTHLGIPHGLACSFTLPELLRANLDMLPANDAEHSLLCSVLSMLDSFNLGDRVLDYAPLSCIVDLQDEMFTPGRADNYMGREIGGPRKLLLAALSQRASLHSR